MPCCAMPRPLHILLADDSLPDRLLAEVAFDSQDVPVHVTYCEDGLAVLETLLAAGAVRPDVVVLDLNMPRMDGHETLRSIRAHPDLRHYPVAILTSSASDADVTQAYAHFASLYMIKEIDLGRFTEQIGAFVAFYSQCRFESAATT